MNTLPVLWLQHHTQERVLDPEHIAMIQRERERHARLLAGETVEEVYGPADDPSKLREMIQRLRDENPGMPARYRLPKHWHWMGDGVHDHPWHGLAVRVPFSDLAAS